MSDEPAKEDAAEGATSERSNFIYDIIDEDLAQKKNAGRVHTRFPPEPNGYLHIGHAKNIVLNFELAKHYQGKCNLRFDDTNPVKEDTEYVDSIQADIRWLGYAWDELCYASDYFDQLYAWAQGLIRAGKAYVDSQTYEEIKGQRGTLKDPGQDSPFRDRPVEESLELFEEMKAGKLDEGSCVLRAKIDMSSPILNLRDPVIYRIKKATHHRTGDKWCIYPMYDWAHGQSDAIEGVTHSICTLEFQNHRPLYDWYLENIDAPDVLARDGQPYQPKQIEFARLNLTYTLMSKRKLLKLVQDGVVAGWDDPRMPTLSGLRRRGYTPAAIRAFCDEVGVAKRDGVIEVQRLEAALRADLEQQAPRVMGVLDPLKLVIENYPEGETETRSMPYHSADESKGRRDVPFGRELYIERDDFMEDPPKKFFRLAPGREVRLRYAYFVTCTDVIKDDEGNITEIRCTYDPETKGGAAPDGRKVKGTLHWVSAQDSLDVEVRVFDHLFTVENPGVADDVQEVLNPASRIVSRARVEPSLASATSGDIFQFERKGYFVVDPDSQDGALVFNRSVPLRDSWAKQQKKQPPQKATNKPSKKNKAPKPDGGS